MRSSLLSGLPSRARRGTRRTDANDRLVTGVGLGGVDRGSGFPDLAVCGRGVQLFLLKFASL